MKPRSGLTASASSNRRTPARIRGALLFAAVAAGYVAGWKLAANWFSAEDQGASFFPPAGVSLAALVLVSRRRWPVVLAAVAASELALDLSAGTGLVASCGYALANTAEPLAGALLLTGLVGRADLRRSYDLSAFIACAVIAAPVVGGVIAATTFVFVDGYSGWLRFAFEWWSGDGLGVLVVGGALLSLRFARELRGRRLVEGALLAAVAVLATVAVFAQGWFEFVYLPVAVLVALAFRVGTTGVAVTSAIVAFAAAGSTARARDFWESIDVSPADRILYLQLALAVIIASVLALAAEIAERERIALKLARTESEREAALELATLADLERTARSRTERLQALTASLAAAASVSEVVEAVVEHGVAMLGGSSGTVSFPTGDGSALRIVASSAHDAETVAHWTPYQAGLVPAVARTLETGEVVLDESLAGTRSASPALPADDYPGQPLDRASAVAPLVGARGSLLGVVYVGFRGQRSFDASDRRMVQALASQGAQALERALAFEAEQEARRRAELLEGHAARLAAAATTPEVARTTLAGLEAVGVAVAWVQLVRDGSLELLAHSGLPEENVERYGRYPLTLATPPAQAARSGEAVVAGTGAELDSRFPDSAPGRRRLGFESLVSIPLASAGGRALGVLTFTSLEPHWLGESRRQLVMGLAEQCGLALERAELQAEADAAASEDALLALLGEKLERATGSRERAAALVRTLCAEHAACAAVHLVDDGGGVRLLAEASGAEGGAADRAALSRVASAAVAADRPAARSQGNLRLIAAPLRARGRVLGALAIGVPLRRGSRRELQLVERVATRTALALDNALLYEQERDVSHALQMGLLGGEPADVPEAAVATAYRPGTAGLEVGGDWYDAFRLADGRLALVVGDVVGHGLEAAVAMGQLRGAVRALAPVGTPREVIERLDEFVDTLPEAAMATIAYAELDLGDGRLAYTCAGHPPPLLVPADGSPRLLWLARSAPLGSSFATGREEALDRLAPGDTIVLYSDGLVERRSRSVAAGLEQLLNAAREQAGAPPSQLVDGILDALLEDRAQEDDVCLLAVRLVGTERRFEHAFPAAPPEVARMRGALADWLERVDLHPERRRDVLLAAAEAAANAAEHAYGFDGAGVVRVEAWVSGSELHLSVHDEGDWREGAASEDRGRGHGMIEALMRVVTIDRGDAGTVVRMSVPTRAGTPS